MLQEILKIDEVQKLSKNQLKEIKGSGDCHCPANYKC